MTRSRLFRTVGPLALLFAILLASCEEDHPCMPQGPIGELTGRITAIGKPVDALVTAYYLEKSGDSYEPHWLGDETETDSTGAYSLPLRAGRYVVHVDAWPASCCAEATIWNGSLSYTEADTFVVEGSGEPIRADVRLGEVDLQVGVPPQLEGKMVEASLQPVDGGRDGFVQTTVASGQARFVFPAVVPGR